jgi:hypothetical protein
VVNISLLTKWRWNFLVVVLLCGKTLLGVSTYGEEVIGKMVWEEGSQLWFSSLWWKDLCSIGFNLD